MRIFSGFCSVLWVVGGLLALPLCGRSSAEEASQHLLTSLSSTTSSGFVDTSAQWNIPTGNPEIPEPSTVGLALMTGIGLYLDRRKILKH